MLLSVRKITLWSIILPLLLTISPNVLQAQEELIDNLSSQDISQLSDSQISNYAQRAFEQGFTIDDLETIARQRGVPESEIIKIRNRYREIQGGGSLTEIELNTTEFGDGFFDITLPADNQLGQIPRDTIANNVDSDIFGYSLFSSNTLSFAPNLNIPTP